MKSQKHLGGMSVRIMGLVLIVVLAQPAMSQTETYWQGTVGDWSDQANWTNGEPSTLNYGDYAFINNGGTAQITQPGQVCNRLYLGFKPTDSGNGILSGTGHFFGDEQIIGSKGTGIHFSLMKCS